MSEDTRGRPPSLAQRAMRSALAVVLAAGTMMGQAVPQAYAAESYSQVDNSVFFNEGGYVNQTGNMQTPPFNESDFEVHGGHVVKLSKSENPDPETGARGSIYTTCQIWPSLIGHDADNGVEGWAFIADNYNDAAEGASVSMTYTNIGTYEEAGDDSVKIPVDVKVTYTISDVADASHIDTYPQGYEYDGRPVIQFTDNFSWGTFQFGVMDMTASYELINSNTGLPLECESVYYTKTSMDKGETLAVDANAIWSSPTDPGVYLSAGAPPVKGNPDIHPETQYDAIPGTHLYNGAHYGHFDGYVSFSGVPHTYASWQQPGVEDWTPVSPPEYMDVIGDPSYYWRSTCVRIDTHGTGKFSVHHGAVGWTNWTNGFDIPDPAQWDNGGMMYTTHNFLPLTNPKPKAPEKTINGGTDLVTGVGIGDTVHYDISQKVVDMGHDGLVKYESFKFVDELPEYVSYVDGSATITDPFGNEVTQSDWSVEYDEGSNTVTATFTSDYLKNRMVYNGGEYTFGIDVEVHDQPADDLETVKNDGEVVINGQSQTSNVVEYEPIKPELQIEKHADLQYKLASAISEYEYLNHDENPDDFSTVHYVGYMQNTTDATRAKNVTIYDTLPAGLSLVPGSVKVTGADGIKVTENGVLGWSATLPDLYPWTQVKFEYDCYTNSAGNGREIVNTAKTWCTNAELGTPGAEDKHAADDGEIYVNDPNLVITKSVAESPVQNSDYVRGEEYRVDDVFEYTVTLANDKPGTFAKNVRLADEDIPDGFELVGDIEVTGLDESGAGYKIPYPIAGESDSVHGEEETRTIEWSKAVDDNGEAWGWHVDINYLDYNRTVTVKFKVRATQETNGWEVYNRSFATADNQPNDTFLSTDARTGADYTVVWINTPEFDVQKDVRKTDKAYQVGDIAAYDVVLNDLKTPGTLARETTLEDVFQTEGTTIIENSFVITDKPEKADDIRDSVELNRHVGDQNWHIDMTQVYGDADGYWVCSDDFRYEFKDGELTKIEGEHNPVQTKPAYDEDPCQSDDVTPAHDYFKVHYEATVNDMALQNDLVVNDATADSLEGFPVTDREEITVIGAQLAIDKSANDGGHFNVGDIADYELTITNNAVGTVAEDVQIEDSFTTAKAGAVAIVEGSVRLYDNQNEEIALPEGAVFYVKNEAGNAYGFTVDTDYDLSSDQKITVRYEVKYLTNNGSSVVKNVASTWASNAPRVSDYHETWPSDVDQAKLVVDKGSDKQEYKGGEVGSYTLHVTNSDEATAEDVTIHDEIATASRETASVVKGSVKVYDNDGAAVAGKVTYLVDAAGRIYGFDVETGYDLETGRALNVEYQVKFNEVAQDTRVHNDVWAAGSNTSRATDDHDVTVKPGKAEEAGALSIVKASEKSAYKPGEIGKYRLVVKNESKEASVDNVVVSDAIDSASQPFASIVDGSVTVRDASGNIVGGAQTSYSPSGFTTSTGISLAAGESLTVEYQVQFAEEGEFPASVHNTAVAQGDDVPPAKDDNTVTVTDDETAPALSIEKKADTATAQPGDEVTYTITVKQTVEGALAKDVRAVDTLPEGFEVDLGSITIDGKSAAGLTLLEGNELTIALGDMEGIVSKTVSYSGTIAEDFAGSSLRNVAIATSPNIPDKPQDEETVEVTPATDPIIAIEKHASTDVALPGEEFAWVIAVQQTVPGMVAHNVVVTDVVPEGFEVFTDRMVLTDDQGNVIGQASYDETTRTVTARFAELAYGKPAAVAFAGRVAADFAGEELVNVAEAVSDETPEPVSDDATVRTVADPAAPGDGDNPTDEPTDEPTDTPQKTVGKTIAKTGDAIMAFMADWWPAVIAAVGCVLAAIWILPRRFARDEE